MDVGKRLVDERSSFEPACGFPQVSRPTVLLPRQLASGWGGLRWLPHTALYGTYGRKGGRPSIPPEVRSRGYFEGTDSHCMIMWRCAERVRRRTINRYNDALDRCFRTILQHAPRIWSHNLVSAVPGRAPGVNCLPEGIAGSQFTPRCLALLAAQS